MIYTEKQTDRFWNNVAVGEPDECWPWKRSTNAGYGQVALANRILKAHKVAWEIHNGVLLSLNVRASHSCDNKLCCNPRHVVVEPSGIVTDKLTGARGENHGNSKLTERQVKTIKYRLNALTTREIADIMRVSFHTVWDIRKGITWRHV